MSDATPKIGDTVRSVFTGWEVAIDSELRLWWAKEKVQQGSFEIVEPPSIAIRTSEEQLQELADWVRGKADAVVIVDPQPQEEPGPNTEGSNE